MAYADAFQDHGSRAVPCAAPTREDEQTRARALIFALASADQTYDDLGPHLKRALGFERRPLDRQPRRVRQELELAARKLAVLTRQIETALASLPSTHENRSAA